MGEPARVMPPPRARGAAPRRKRRTWLWLLGITLAIAAAVVLGIFGGLLVARRVETGKWEMPEVQDVVQAIQEPPPPQASKIIFLEGGPVTVAPGTDDAARGTSAVMTAHHPGGPVTMPGWKGSKKAWTKLVACVKKMFAPFDVEVTDQRPAGDDFILVAAGGKPSMIGVKEKYVAGLAPFNGAVIPRAVVFAFAGQLGHEVRTTCETIAMEVAHAYGLDHEYLCKDVMTYLSGCGAKSFVDKDAPCGEKKKRPCYGGAPTQNSVKRLEAVLGKRPPAP